MARVVYLARIVAVVTEDDVKLPPLPESRAALRFAPPGETAPGDAPLPIAEGATIAIEPCCEDRAGHPVAVVYLGGLRPGDFSPK